jgi:hypothetical protein
MKLTGYLWNNSLDWFIEWQREHPTYTILTIVPDHADSLSVFVTYSYDDDQ